MKTKRYAVMLTEAEMVALFMECNCCSNPADFASAADRVFGKLKQIGYFRRQRKRAQSSA